MVYPICTIKDAKTACWPPQCYETTAAAVRDFAMQVNSGRGALAYSPADFILYKVGEFDTEKGTIKASEPIVQLCAGLDVVGVKDA